MATEHLELPLNDVPTDHEIATMMIQADVENQLVNQGGKVNGKAIQLKPDKVYYLTFAADVPDWIANSPHLSCRANGRVYELNTVNVVGSFRLGPIDVVVHSNKISKEAFRRLVDDVALYLAGLPFDVRGAGTGFEASRAHGSPITYHAFVYISHLLRSGQLQAALEQITADPHTVFTNERYDVRVDQARVTDPTTVRRLCTSPQQLTTIRHDAALFDSALARTLAARCEGSATRVFPLRVDVPRTRVTVDNPENQFVRHVLETMVATAQRVASARHCPPDIAAEAAWVEARLASMLSHGLFWDVSRPRHLVFSSPVLQRRSGYRQMLAFYADMMQPPTAAWEADLHRILELKDAATLYEYWVFVSVCQAVEAVLGRPMAAKRVAVDPLQARLVRGMRVRWANGVTVHYNPALKGYSGRFIPDVVVETEAGMWVFDAKFRMRDSVGLASEEDSEGEVDDRESKREDIHKMHAYRDALTPRCRGAYVVFPGSVPQTYPAELGRETSGSSLGIDHPSYLDGVGAIPLRPDRGRGFLSQVIRYICDLLPTD